MSLLKNTLKDLIGGFFLVMVILIIAFGSTIYFLNIDRYYDYLSNRLITNYDDLNLLVDPAKSDYPWQFTLSLWKEYLIMLGITDV